MISRRWFLSLAGGSSVGLLAYGDVQAEPYPQRPVKMIVGAGAGSPLDMVARAIADRLSLSLKQPFVVESRTGAAGNIGAEFVAKAAPDGYTLLMAIGSTLTVNPNVYKSIGFDPDRDFRPISILTSGSLLLALHPTLPANSVSQFVAFAKKERVTYGTGGNGSPGHLAMEYFRLRAGFETVPVPYRSLTSMRADLLSGQIKVAFTAVSGAIEHVRAGRLKALAISAPKRSPLAPDVPTIAESGYPDFQVETQLVMLAPARIADPIAERLEQHVQLALSAPDLAGRLRAQGYEIAGIHGADARTQLRAERELWAKVVKEAAIRVE